MPKLWSETVGAHRREVREAILETTAALVAEHGLLAVTMSQIAESTGIGRATLYKYFPDIEAIVAGWHEREVSAHLEQLAEIARRPGSARERLEAVLETSAVLSQGIHSSDLGSVLRQRDHVASAHEQARGHGLAHAHERLHDLIRTLLAEAAVTRDVRDDVSPDELAGYCLHALSAARNLPSKAAARRLVKVILTGLRTG